MRVAAAIAVLACAGAAQFTSTIQLVVAPTTITDSKGLTPEGVTVQTSSNSGAVIDKLGDSGILLTRLLAADAGETAMTSFGDEVKVHLDL